MLTRPLRSARSQQTSCSEQLIPPTPTTEVGEQLMPITVFGSTFSPRSLSSAAASSALAGWTVTQQFSVPVEHSCCAEPEGHTARRTHATTQSLATKLDLVMIAMKLRPEATRNDPGAVMAVCKVRCTGSAVDASADQQLPWNLDMAARLAAELYQLLTLCP